MVSRRLSSDQRSALPCLPGDRARGNNGSRLSKSARPARPASGLLCLLLDSGLGPPSRCALSSSERTPPWRHALSCLVTRALDAMPVHSVCATELEAWLKWNVVFKLVLRRLWIRLAPCSRVCRRRQRRLTTHVYYLYVFISIRGVCLWLNLVHSVVIPIDRQNDETAVIFSSANRTQYLAY